MARGGRVYLATQQKPDIAAGSINLNGIVDVTNLSSAGYGGAVNIQSSNDIISTATIRAGSGSLYSEAAETNAFRGNYDADYVTLKGRDVIYGGAVSGTGALDISADKAFNIASGARPKTASKNTLYQYDIENFANNFATTSITSNGKFTIKNLKGDELNAGNSLSIKGESVIAQDRNDSLISRNKDITISGKEYVNIGNVKGKDNVVISSGGYLKAGNIESNRTIGVYGIGNVNIGNVIVNNTNEAAAVLASSALDIFSEHDITTGDIKINTNTNTGPQGVLGRVFINSPENITTGDIGVSSFNTGSSISGASIELNGADIKAKNIYAEAIATGQSDPAFAYITLNASNKFTAGGDISAAAIANDGGNARVNLTSAKKRAALGNYTVTAHSMDGNGNIRTGSPYATVTITQPAK